MTEPNPSSDYFEREKLSLLTQELTEGPAEIFEISGELIDAAERQFTPKMPENHPESLRSNVGASNFPSPRTHFHPDSSVQSIPSVLPRTMQDFVLDFTKKSSAAKPRK